MLALYNPKALLAAAAMPKPSPTAILQLWWQNAIVFKSHALIILQEATVGLFRSDYFFCCANQCIKQVEFNTIASSFGCTTTKLVHAHKY